MLKNRTIVIISFFTLNHFCFAGDMGETNNSWHKGATFSLGSAWSSPGNTQTIYFTPTYPQTYVARSNSAALASGEFFLNMQKKISQKTQAQVGIAFAATTKIQLKGTIWQDADASFDNLNYAYKISHSHIAIRGKLLQETPVEIKPYIGASIGVGFNHSYNYSSIPKLLTISAAPPFASNVNTALTYTLDAGIHKELNKHWAIEIGYEFMDWGKTYLNRASDQSVGTGLSLNHVYTNAIQVSLDFVA